MAAKSPMGRSIYRFAVFSWRGEGPIMDRRFSSFPDVTSAVGQSDEMAKRGFSSRVIDLDLSPVVYSSKPQ